MARINLLPWREALRKEQQRDFGVLMVLFAALAGAIVFITHLYFVNQIEFQGTRNRYLTTEIKKLDEKIKEIPALEKEKQRLIARMRAIEELQRNRPLIVRFFDELVASLPEGVSILKIQQKSKTITINGEAQSNARVSSFMRNLESSKWLANPKLDIIQAKDASGQRISAFTLKFTQVIPKAEGEEEEES
jgi:type IV pilus assembly protein PilN